MCRAEVPRKGNTSERPAGDDLSFLCIAPPTRVQATAGEAGGCQPHACPGLAIHLPRTGSPQSSMTASAASRHRHRCAHPPPFPSPPQLGRARSAAVGEGCLRFAVLNTKGFGVNFNKARIIIGKFMSGKQIFADVR
jgi:hypothetical protein